MSDVAKTFWLQLTLEARHCSPEQLEAALLRVGAMAVTLRDAGDQPVLEPLPGQTPMWPQTLVTGLFDADADVEVITRHLSAILGVAELPLARIESLEERDWERSWLDDFRPMRFGERLWVCPSGSPAPGTDAVILELDPGLAFGTGTHPTTALCLEWLERIELAGKTVIDYGCGSGILAIAALKLGATHVRGVDIDPQALLASEQNAARNGVLERLDLHNPDAMPLAQADVLVANILSGPLIDLARSLSDSVKPEGRLALSGILPDQAETVRNAFRPWVRFDDCNQRGEWLLLSAFRSSQSSL
jgi:ribosomal protein L11 methyltransferase